MRTINVAGLYPGLTVQDGSVTHVVTDVVHSRRRIDVEFDDGDIESYFPYEQVDVLQIEAREFVANPREHLLPFDHGYPFQPNESIAEGAGRQRLEMEASYIAKTRSTCCAAELRAEREYGHTSFHCTACGERHP